MPFSKPTSHHINSHQVIKTFVIAIGLLVLSFFLFSKKEFSEEPIFTPEEQIWLLKHPLVTVAPDIDYAPVEFEDNGELKGIAMDYLKWMEAHYSIRFKTVHYDTWAQVIAAAKNKQVDMLSGAAKTPEREHFLHFTKPYITTPTVIVRKKDSTPILNEEGLIKLTVGAIKGYAVNEFLQLRYPSLKIVSVVNIEDGLLKVSNGELDAMAAEAYQASYYVSALKLSNLIIESNYNVDFPLKLSMASRINAPELASIIDKMIDSMPSSERMAIEQKWIGLNPNSGISKTILIAGSIVFILLSLVIVSILVWNRTLKTRVREKTKELTDLNTLLEAKVARRTQLLSDTNQQLELSMYNLQMKEHELENINAELESTLVDLQLSQKRLIEVEKVAALGQLVATVAHEINTPLGNCIMSNEFLNEKSRLMKAQLCEEQQLSENVCDYFDTLESGHAIIESSLEQLKVIVDRFKALAVKNLSARETELDLKQLLEECLIEHQFKNGFEWHIDVENPVKILGIRMVYNEIFNNLIANTITHGFSKDISHPKIKVKLKKIDSTLFIEFEDNGKGIEDEIIHRVIEPLFTTNRVGGSGGIGLNVIMNLLNHTLDGDMSIQNLTQGGLMVKIRIRHIQWIEENNL